MILRKEEEEEEETKVQPQQTETLRGTEHNSVQVMGKKKIYIHIKKQIREQKQWNGNRDGVGKRGNNTDKGHYFCQGICRCPDNEQSESQLDDVHDRKG